MSYATREISTYSGQPFELYLFQSGEDRWQLTSGDVSRTYNGKVYTPEAIERTEIDQDQEAHSGEIEVTLPRTHDLASRFVSYIPTSPVSLVIFRGHDGEGEVVPNFTGRVSKAAFTDVCTLTVSSEADLLRKKVPTQRFQNQCNWCLFSAGCGLQKVNFMVTGTLSSVAGDTIKSAAFATKPDGWFNAGFIECGSDMRMILSHTGDTLVLIAGISGLAAGDTFKAYAGCQRTVADCRNKFSNLANYRGFDKIPTKNPFDGGLV